MPFLYPSILLATATLRYMMSSPTAKHGSHRKACESHSIKPRTREAG